MGTVFLLLRPDSTSSVRGQILSTKSSFVESIRAPDLIFQSGEIQSKVRQTPNSHLYDWKRGLPGVGKTAAPSPPVDKHPVDPTPHKGIGPSTIPKSPLKSSIGADFRKSSPANARSGLLPPLHPRLRHSPRPPLNLPPTKPAPPDPAIINEFTGRARVASLPRFLPAMEICAAEVEAMDMGGDNTAEEEGAGDQGVDVGAC